MGLIHIASVAKTVARQILSMLPVSFDLHQTLVICLRSSLCTRRQDHAVHDRIVVIPNLLHPLHLLLLLLHRPADSLHASTRLELLCANGDVSWRQRPRERKVDECPCDEQRFGRGGQEARKGVRVEEGGDG